MHMELQITRKGSLYECECAKCGATMFAHEWASNDVNEERDAMQNGTLHCSDCCGVADPKTYRAHTRKHYAARYSANGYLDCTNWEYGTNKQKLLRDVRAMYK